MNPYDICDVCIGPKRGHARQRSYFTSSAIVEKEYSLASDALHPRVALLQFMFIQTPTRQKCLSRIYTKNIIYEKDSESVNEQKLRVATYRELFFEIRVSRSFVD